MPVIGIQEMLNQSTDTWCMHDKRIDFDFINQNYKCVIIGGAGLLHECFESFWQRFLSECKLPTIMWGIGVCLPDETGVRTDLKASTEKYGVSKDVILEVANKCDLINVRDDLTADYYNLKNASITACPTVVYLEKFKKHLKPTNEVLYSSHKELVRTDEQEEIYKMISKVTSNFSYTDNIQTYKLGLDDIIRRHYCRSKLVVTTRLHGAITAYGLGIPYIAIPRDKKVREFVRIYSNGLLLENIAELPNAIQSTQENNPIDQEIKINDVKVFGEKAKNWLQTHII